MEVSKSFQGVVNFVKFLYVKQKTKESSRKQIVSNETSDKLQVYAQTALETKIYLGETNLADDVNNVDIMILMLNSFIQESLLKFNFKIIAIIENCMTCEFDDNFYLKPYIFPTSSN